MTPTTASMIKCQKIIQSCETGAQLELANKYIRLVVRKAYSDLESRRGFDAWFDAQDIDKILTRLYNEQIKLVFKKDEAQND